MIDLMSRFFSFFALVVFVMWSGMGTATYPTLSPSSACFAIPPGNGTRQGTTIKLGIRPWLSHKVSSALMEIALKEYLRFSVTLIDLSSANEEEWGADLSNGLYDIDVESIYGAETSAGYAQYVTTDQSVYVAGSPGYFRRKGLFTTPGALSTSPLATWYKWYKDASAISNAGYLMYSSAEVSSLKVAVGNSWPLCSYAWCGTGAMDGLWAPTACQSSPTSCGLALMDTAGETARYEQMAARQSMKLIYAYLGTSLESKVKEKAAAGENVVFSWWLPDALPVAVNAERIAFPDYSSACVDSAATTPAGTTNCDFPDISLYKLQRASLKASAPEAYLLVQKFLVYIAQLDSVIKDTTQAGGTMTPFDAACKFFKNNPNLVETWVEPAPPDVPCIIRPPATPKNGDFLFDSFTMSCQEVFRFPAVSVPACYSSTTMPAKVDRSQFNIKVCAQNWLTNEIVTQVGLIMLRDFLGYSVEMIDLASSSTAVIYENIMGGACDMDLESWQAGKAKPKYIDYVTNQQAILNPGTIGFDGRSSLYVTPDAVDNHEMASYWKFYKTGQDLTNVKIVHYGQLGQTPTYPPTMQALDPAFPNCRTTTSWCTNIADPSSPFYGYWVPPQCIPDPTKCILAFHYASSWDEAYFETAAQTLGLQMIFAYYGAKTTGLVSDIATNKTTNVLFYWWEPDPYPTRVGGVRLSYPDYYLGCDSTNTANPNTGSIPCDYAVQPLQKIIKATVRSRTPQAYYLLENLFITMDQIQTMLLMHTDGGGNLSTGNAVACEWIKQNQALVEQDWAKDCIRDPVIGNIKIGDSLWDSNTRQCKTIACNPDQSIIPGTADCKTCGAGQMPNQARTDCVSCPAGMVPNRSETNWDLRCTPCQPGYYCPFGAELPVACAKGMYRSTQDPIECVDCDRGFYQAEEGQSACLSCPVSMTTGVAGARYATDCICPASMYKPKNATGIDGLPADPNATVCKDCPPGMECAEGSDGLNIPCTSDGQLLDIVASGPYPIPEIGNFARCEDPLSCFKCLSDSACPGKAVQVCAEGMEGIACGRCKKDWYKSGDVCRKCNDAETSNLIFPTLPLLIAPIGIAVFYKCSQDTITRWNSPANSLAASLFVTLIYIQTLAAISTCYVAKPQVVEDNTNWVTVTYDLLSLLRPGCTTFTDFKMAFIGKILLPVYALILFIFDFCVSQLVATLCMEKLRMDIDMTFNCYMAVFNTFFIGIAQQTFTLFQCYKHPNGEKSLRSQADVLCDSDDWNSLVVVASVAVVVFCGGFLVLNMYICYVAPSRFSDARFRKRWKFLFIKYRPSAWWWGMVLLVKGIWVNLPTVVFDYGAAQILWLQGAILTYMLACFAISPWRTFIVALLDILMHSSLVFLFGFITHFVDMGDSDSNDMGQAYSFFAIMPVAAGGCVVLFFLYQRLFPPQTDWNAAAAEVSTVFAQLGGNTEKLARVLPYLPFADIITLNRVKHLVQVELGQEAKPNAMTNHMLLNISQRSRLMVDYDNGTKSASTLAKLTEYEEDGSDNALPGESTDSAKVHDAISKMRKQVRPDEVWLCSALEMAVSGQAYDVDSLRAVYGEKRNGGFNLNEPQEVEEAIPQENTLHEHLSHGIIILQSPRSVPAGGIATPRSPRSRGATPRGTPRGTPTGTPLGSPRLMNLERIQRESTEHTEDVPMMSPRSPRSPRGNN